MSALLMLSCQGREAGPAVAEVPADSIDSVSIDTVDVDTLEQLITEAPLPQAADELFDDFLFNFAANKKLQLSRIVFPLPVERNGKTEHVDKNSWRMEHFFMRQGYYTVIFDSEQQKDIVKDTSVTHAVVEKIYFNTGAVIQYEFRRVRRAWMMCKMTTIPISSSHEQSFLDFYHKFATDSAYQVNSLAETVEFTGPDPDDDFSQTEGLITRDTWAAFAPELPRKMIYNIVYGNGKSPSNQRILVMKGIANGLEMELTFRRNGDSWILTKMNT